MGESANASPSLEQLTDRELEVLQLLGDGMSDREISKALFIVRFTASNHVAHLRHAIGARNRSSAAIFAVNHRQAIADERTRRKLADES